jgi:hypothetical protein
MKNNKNAPSNLGALFNKKDTIIASLMIAMIAFLWFVTTQFEKVPDLFSNNIPPEMFPQILLTIILLMVLVIPFEHIFLKKNGKDIDASRKKPRPKINNRYNGYFVIDYYFISDFRSNINNSCY